MLQEVQTTQHEDGKISHPVICLGETSGQGHMMLSSMGSELLRNISLLLKKDAETFLSSGL